MAVEVSDGLLDAATEQRLASGPGERRLRVADLEVGDIGVLRVQAQAVHPVQTFQRKNGGEGMLRRVTLADSSGDVDLVLWGDETQQAIDGPFVAGAHVILRGATVKAGFRGGVEVQLGGAVVEPVETVTETVTVEGVLDHLGDTQVSGAAPNIRFQAEAALVTSLGRVQVVLWDECVKAARAVLPGATVRIDGATAHPLLEGWFVADSAVGANLTHR